MNLYILEFSVKFLLKTDTKMANHHTGPPWHRLLLSKMDRTYFLFPFSCRSPVIISSTMWLWISHERVTSAFCYRALPSGRTLNAVTGGHPVGYPFGLLSISWTSEKSDSTLWQMKMSSWKFSARMWFWAKHKGFSS